MTSNKLIADIQAIKEANQFKNYIDFIQFPYYRNVEPDTRITFDFPLTVFVGQNGSGKSSTLHAIQGCPAGYTPYKFWFDTKVDPIQYSDEEHRRHSFFYSYKDQQGNDLEVIKARIQRENNPNYWETSRPLKWAKMKPLPRGIERNAPIRKNVVYIDFRSELSAFDKYFYFQEPGKNLKSKNKQEYLQRKSINLATVIENPLQIIKQNGVPQNEPVVELSSDELDHISAILGRQYDSGHVIEHKFFKDWGRSVLFTTRFAQYSEAFAGSGEIAAVRLVQEVLKAEEHSLIILDEPEVSLHPGAQNRLKLFLLDQIKKRKHQVIISTHSHVMITGLPNQSIKVFTQNPSTGKFRILSDSTSEEAFYHIELPNPHKKTLIVEDALAKMIVESVLTTFGKGSQSLFEVQFYPGGESVLKSDYIKVYSLESTSTKFIIFDGDQKFTDSHFDPSTLPEKDISIKVLTEKIRKQTGENIKFKPDSNNEDQKLDLMKMYLQYYLQNVFYLPKNEPEEIIWNDDLAKRQLQSINKEDQLQGVLSLTSCKEKFYTFSKIMYDTSVQIELAYRLFINYWKDNENEGFEEIKNLIIQIKNINRD